MGAVLATDKKRVCLCMAAVLAVALAFSAAPMHAAEGKEPARVEWLGYEQGFGKAAELGRFMLVDFYTTWCRDCKKMDKETFSDPEVVRILSEQFTAVKVDAEQRPDLGSLFGVLAYPTIWIVAPDGSRICQRIGYMSPSELCVMLEYATSGSYKTMGFNEFVRSRSGGGGR